MVTSPSQKEDARPGRRWQESSHLVLLHISLEEVIFTAKRAPEIIIPDNVPVIDSSQAEIVDITPELIP